MENKKNKGIIVIFIILLIIILSLVGYFIYQNIYVGNKNSYQLKKFAHYTNDIYSGNIEYDGEYYIFDTLDSLDVYNKKGQNIYHAKGYFRNNGSYIYTSNNKFADYANLGLSKETYDFIVQLTEEYFLVKKNEKNYIINKYGQSTLAFDYKNFSLAYTNNKYLIVTDMNNKVGVTDLLGNIIIPFEYDSGASFIKTTDEYFILLKNNNYHILNTNNEVLLTVPKNNNQRILYDSQISKFVIIDYYKEPIDSPDGDGIISKLNFYSLDGKFVNSVEFNKNWEYYSTFSEARGHGKTLNEDSNFLLIGVFDNMNVSSTINIINQELNTKTIDNIYYEKLACQGICVDYYMTNDLYVTKTNDIYNIHSMIDDKKIYDKDFSYVKWVESLEKLFVCDDNACYFLNEKGEKVDDLTYSKDFANKNIEDFHNDNVLVGNSSESMLSESGFDLYTIDYKKINDKKISNVYEVDEFLITQNKDNKNILIYDNNNELVEYENLDNAKLKLYLGKANGYLFFLTDKGIYNIQID